MGWYADVLFPKAYDCLMALAKIGQEGSDRLRQRVADEITTTFASAYGMELSLTDAVDPAQVQRYGKMATGDKALVTPHH